MTAVDPVVLEIVEGTLASVEAEVEAAIERTSRSPMIREARDFRGGIHDRHCRKLTGRSYSALVQPIVRDFPIETIQPGDKTELTVDLDEGTYEIYCPVGDHKDRGMVGTLTVGGGGGGGSDTETGETETGETETGETETGETETEEGTDY